MIAVGELLAAIFIYEEKYNINKECAANLYKAIVGDSGRFLYSDTTAHTFFVAKRLIEKGIDINKIYSEMYDESITDLEVRKYILKTSLNMIPCFTDTFFNLCFTDSTLPVFIIEEPPYKYEEFFRI